MTITINNYAPEATDPSPWWWLVFAVLFAVMCAASWLSGTGGQWRPK